MKKRTVILGASPNPSRYSFFAAKLLQDYGHEVIPVGIKKGEVGGTRILDIRQKPELKDIDTITIYLGPKHQPEWYDYIVGLKPRRVIFNPGTENDEFIRKLSESGVEAFEACTLVMLRTNQY